VLKLRAWSLRYKVALQRKEEYMQNIRITQAVIENLELLAELFDKYRQFYKQPSNLKQSKSFIKKRIENQDSVIFLAFDDCGRALGFTQLYPIFSSIFVKPKWILNDLYVDENSRRQGLARRLLNKAKELAIETSADSIFLETGVANKSAQALYESLGYARETEHLSYFLKT